MEDIYGEELRDSAEYKKYYLPLKNYIRNELGKDQEPTLEQRIELKFEIPQKYYNKNYKKLRDNKFPKLFKGTILEEKHFNENKKEWITRIKSYDNYAEIDERIYFLKNASVKILDDIPIPKDFAKHYVKLKKLVDDYNADSNEWHIRKFSDMNEFLIAITPKPLSEHIETLLNQINQEKLNLVNTKKKQELADNNKANDISERPQDQKKTDKREKNHGQEGKQPLIDFRKLIPQDIQWKQIEINILDEDSIKIKYPGGSFDVRFSQTQRFINKTTSKCNDLWSLLLELSLIECFQPNDHTYKILTKKPGKAKNRVYALGKALMDEFGNIEKPFLPYNSQDGWMPIFTIRDFRKNHYRTNNTAELYKAQQTVKRKQHQDFPHKIGNTFSSDDLDNYANEQKEHQDKLDYKDKGFHPITEDEL